jgi:glycosyltransferase involved in cell wall biosynthesis
MAARDHIALYLPSLAGGGAERVFVQLANRFAARGLRTSLLLASATGPYRNEVARDVEVIDLQARGVMHSVPRLTSWLRAAKPDALLSALDHANIAALIAARRAGIRCVISVRSMPSAVYREERGLRRYLLPFLMRRLYARADAVIANSQAAARDLQEQFAVPAARLSVIYNPLDLAQIERLAAEAVDDEWLRAAASPLLLAVGSLTHLKDFPTLLRAFARVSAHRDCRLAILGEGPCRTPLQTLAAELNLGPRLHLPGFVANPFAWMRAARLVISSSLTEGFPNGLLQSLACGTPVVSTDGEGGVRELLEGGRWGTLVPVGDHQALAAAIDAQLDRPAPEVRRRAADFANDGIAQQFLRHLLPAAPPRAGA